jgi:heme exporter protein D
LTDYLAMGGYAAYVWSAFSIALALMMGLFFQSRRMARRREAELTDLRARLERGHGSRAMRPRRESEPSASSAGEGG